MVGNAGVALRYKIVFNNDLSSFYSGGLISLIVISIAAMVHAIMKTYIGYLNRRSVLLLFVNFTGVYSLWLFYYLLFMTGYWFLFTKTTTTPFLLLPPSDTTLYSTFYILVGIMVVFRLIYSFK